MNCFGEEIILISKNSYTDIFGHLEIELHNIPTTLLINDFQYILIDKIGFDFMCENALIDSHKYNTKCGAYRLMMDITSEKYNINKYIIDNNKILIPLFPISIQEEQKKLIDICISRKLEYSIKIYIKFVELNKIIILKSNEEIDLSKCKLTYKLIPTVI